jgi:hypothetical protein
MNCLKHLHVNNHDIITLWEFNIAIEHGPFIAEFTY